MILAHNFFNIVPCGTISVTILLARHLHFPSALDSLMHVCPSPCALHLLASLALVTHWAVDSHPGFHPVNISKFRFCLVGVILPCPWMPPWFLGLLGSCMCKWCLRMVQHFVYIFFHYICYSYISFHIFICATFGFGVCPFRSASLWCLVAEQNII